MLEAKTRQKTKKSTRYLVLGYLIAGLVGCLGSYIVFLGLCSLYDVSNVFFVLVAVSSGGMIGFTLSIYLFYAFFLKLHPNC